MMKLSMIVDIKEIKLSMVVDKKEKMLSMIVVSRQCEFGNLVDSRARDLDRALQILKVFNTKSISRLEVIITIEK